LSKNKTGNLIVKTTIRRYINSQGCNVSAEVLNKTLNLILKNLLDKAIEHAKNENRKIIKPRDLIG